MTQLTREAELYRLLLENSTNLSTLTKILSNTTRIRVDNDTIIRLTALGKETRSFIIKCAHDDPKLEKVLIETIESHHTC